MSDDKKPSCGASLDEHIDLTLAAMEAIGSGLGCEIQYQAFVILTEAARQFHGFAPFDAAEKVKRLVEDARKLQAKLDEAKQQPVVKPQPKWFLPDMSGKVH